MLKRLHFPQIQASTRVYAHTFSWEVSLSISSNTLKARMLTGWCGVKFHCVYQVSGFVCQWDYKGFFFQKTTGQPWVRNWTWRLPSRTSSIVNSGKNWHVSFYLDLSTSHCTKPWVKNSRGTGGTGGTGVSEGRLRESTCSNSARSNLRCFSQASVFLDIFAHPWRDIVRNLEHQSHSEEFSETRMTCIYKILQDINIKIYTYRYFFGELTLAGSKVWQQGLEQLLRAQNSNLTTNMLNMTEWYWTYFFKSLKRFIFSTNLTLCSFAFASIEFYQFGLRSPRLRWQPQHFCCLLLKLLLGRCHTRQRLSNLASQNNQFRVLSISFFLLHSAFLFYFRFFPHNLGDLSYFHLPSIQKDQLYLEAIVQQPLVNTASSLPTTGVAARVPMVPQGSIIFHCCKTAKLAKRLLTEESFCTHKIFLFCLNISVFHFYFSHLSAIPSGISSFSLVEEEASWSSDVQVVTHRHDSSKMWYAIRTTWHLE